MLHHRNVVNVIIIIKLYTERYFAKRAISRQTVYDSGL